MILRETPPQAMPEGNQASKADLEWILEQFGIRLKGRPELDELRDLIAEKFHELHVNLIALGYGEHGISLGVRKARFAALERAANARVFRAKGPG